MGIRSKLASVVLGGGSNNEVRDTVEEVLSERNLVKPSELETLRQQVKAIRDDDTAPESSPAGSQELQMVFGALEATNNQLQEIRSLAEQALAASRQAGQHSTTARATAEATSDGLSNLEEQFANLIERLSTAGLDWNRTATGGRAACTYGTCNNRHHARGLCKKHYRLWRRSQLEDWVGPDGLVPFSSDGSIYKVDKRYAGRAATLDQGQVIVEGTRDVKARRVDV